jgi:hypothetical protein
LTFTDLGVAARAVIALVLVTSAVAKIWTLPRVPTRRPELGGYVVVTVAVAASLPVVELAVAALVLFVDGQWPVVLAALLFAVFTVVLARRLAAGDRRPCNCFGQGTRAVSSASIVRNGWFLALAVVASGADSVGDAPHGTVTIAVGVVLAGVSAVLIVRA